MMHDQKSRGWLIGFVGLALMCTGLTETQAQIEGYIVKKGTGTRIGGTIKWKAGSKAYEIKRGPTVTPIPLSQVQEIRVKAPAGLSDAIKRVQGGSYSGPHVIALAKVVKDTKCCNTTSAPASG